jgi:Protein of unknown function (DUF3237)
MAEIKTEFLFTLALQFDMQVVGDTPRGIRRVSRHTVGSFEGPKLKGTVLPGGGTWTIVRDDGVWELEVRITLETDDKQHIYMHWKGLRHGPRDVMERLDRGEDVDPSTYYFRVTPYFETSSETYGWLNRICAIATGARNANARTLEVFQVL